MGSSRHAGIGNLKTALSLISTFALLVCSQLQAASPEPSFDLLDYVRTHVEEPDRTKIPRYNREKHFGRWINADADVNCFNTRNEVLFRDADKTAPLVIEQLTPEICKIIKGLWHDPYSGEDRTDAATTIEIDHVVALRNAYYAGAHQWNYARRCHYSNYLGNDYHLLAVDGHENTVKLDYSPANYMPPNVSYQCRHLSNWMRVKAIWGLTVTRSERDAILRLVEERGCKTEDTTIPVPELKEQRRKSLEPTEACVREELEQKMKEKEEAAHAFGDPVL